MTDRVRGRFEAGSPRVTKIVAGHLLGLIEPEAIANMAVFLASDKSRMVTGQVYPVGSGITIEHTVCLTWFVPAGEVPLGGLPHSQHMAMIS